MWDMAAKELAFSKLHLLLQQLSPVLVHINRPGTCVTWTNLMGLQDTLWRPSDTGTTHCVVWMRSGITSKMLVLLGVLLPPRAVFSQYGCVLHTWQRGIKASQNKVLRCKAPQDSTEGYVGKREPTLHSLAHTTSTRIGKSPIALTSG